MRLLDMMRRAGSEPAQDSSGQSSLPVYTETKLAPEPVTAVQMPVAVNHIAFFWRGDEKQEKKGLWPVQGASKPTEDSTWPLTKVAHTNGKGHEHKQETGSYDSKLQGPPEDSSKQTIRGALHSIAGIMRKQDNQDAQKGTEVANLGAGYPSPQKHRSGSIKETMDESKTSLLHEGQSPSKKERLGDMPVYNVTKFALQPVGRVQMPVSTKTLDLCWRSDSKAPDLSPERKKEKKPPSSKKPRE